MELKWSKTPLVGKISFFLMFSLFLISLVAIFINVDVGIILILLGLCFVNMIILAKTIMNTSNIRNPKLTQGIVIGKVDSLHNDAVTQLKSPQSFTYNYIIEYVVDGKTYHTTTTFSRGGVLQRENGDVVTVVYAASNPKVAEIVGDRKNSNRVLATLFCAGIVLIIIGIMIIFM